MGDDAAFFRLDEELGTGANELEGATAVDVEKVGGRVDCAEMTVDVEGVEGSGAREALGRDRLNNVARGDVAF